MKLIVVFLLMLLGVVSLAAQVGRPRAEVTPLVEHSAIAGQTVRVALRVSLPEGLHTQSNKPRDETLIPTELHVDATAGVTVDEIVWPPATDLNQAGSDKPLAVFEREFLIGARLSISSGAGEITVPAKLRYQACADKLCYPPTTADSRWVLHVAPASATAALDRSVAGVFARIKFGTGEKPGTATAAGAAIAGAGPA